VSGMWGTFEIVTPIFNSRWRSKYFKIVVGEKSDVSEESACFLAKAFKKAWLCSVVAQDSYGRRAGPPTCKKRFSTRTSSSGGRVTTLFAEALGALSTDLLTPLAS